VLGRAAALHARHFVWLQKRHGFDFVVRWLATLTSPDIVVAEY